MLKTSGRWLVGMLVLAALQGCVSLGQRPASDEVYQRGWLLQEEGSWLWRACQSSAWEAIVLSRNMQRVYQRLAADQRPLYAEWRQRGEARPEWRLLVDDPKGCQQHLPGNLLVAGGTQPEFWQLELKEQQLLLNFPEKLQTLRFNAIDFSREGSDWLWEAEIKRQQRVRHRASLRVKNAPCVDMQGQWYGLQAQLQLDRREYNGCARRGDLQRLSLSSRYRLPQKIQTRAIEVSLSPEGELRWQEDYLNDQPIEIHLGRWQLLENGRLLLTLEQLEKGMETRQEALVMRPSGAGGWRLVGFHPLYGEGGLELVPTGDPLPWRAGSRFPVP
ncbi:hypothetical protein [Nitrincola tapanii]|uniref:Lipoprotein n=1 Tax=Nitrincola tapanii TaxID=1708751 RepID=A0A5A9W6R8_9GAMM|nr:hypothetical protein [Nitrincola tapanii]KAA0875895.1 hypothetical protein E1H14_04195 [Nitrincola tapanii]